MAGRRRSRGAYNFTAKRRNALRRAQMISARRRSRNRRNAAITVGVLAGAGAIAYGGYKYGPQVREGVAKQVTSFKPRMADMRNRLGAMIAVDPVVKQQVRASHALAATATGANRHPPEAVPVKRRVSRGKAKAKPNKPSGITEADRLHAQQSRDALKEELGKNTLGGNAAKRQAERGYNDDLHMTIKDGPLVGIEKAIAGSRTKTISERTARRYLGMQNKVLADAGGKPKTRVEINNEIKALKEMGIVRKRVVRGRKATAAPRRRTRRKLPRTGPASEQFMWTDTQMSDAYAMEF